jgi:hypothetical protein
MTGVITQQDLSFKDQPPSLDEQQACKLFLSNNEIDSPYLTRLHAIFTQQLKNKLGSSVQEIPQHFLDHRVNRLMKAFLKEKLGQQKPIEPAYDLATQAQWDPHSHARSLFTAVFPDARHHLPDFEAAYLYLKPLVETLETKREELLQQIMEERSCPHVTEVGCGYDNWHITHQRKHIIPLLAYTRAKGRNFRDDVSDYDYCGQESESLYQSLEFFLSGIKEGQICRIHMGETMLPERGRDHVTQLLDEADKYYHSSKPLRIGHATHTSLDDMQRIVDKGYYIEACLSSNKKTGILSKRSDYPLGIMLMLGVNVVIGTDGGHLYSTSLALEYAYAARNLKKFCARLQESDDVVQLLNGDQLCFRHVAHLLKEEAPKTSPDEPITYRQLGRYLKDEVLKHISHHQLVQNASNLFIECYHYYPHAL